MIYDNLKHPGMAMAIRVLQKIHFSPFCNSFEKYRDDISGVVGVINWIFSTSSFFYRY